MRNTKDFSPLYRSFIGFDHLAELIDKAQRNEKQASYPPYNIELIADDKYRITMAVAGFTDNELDIESRENALVVTGTKVAKSEPAHNYLHQGIAERSFERKFQLGDHVKVIGAQMEHGLLHILLEREIPEALKPRKISINASTMLEGKAN